MAIMRHFCVMVLSTWISHSHLLENLPPDHARNYCAREWACLRKARERCASTHARTHPAMMKR